MGHNPIPPAPHRSNLDAIREDFANDRITLEDLEVAVERELSRSKICASGDHLWMDISQMGSPHNDEICGKCGLSRASAPPECFTGTEREVYVGATAIAYSAGTILV